MVNFPSLTKALARPDRRSSYLPEQPLVKPFFDSSQLLDICSLFLNNHDSVHGTFLQIRCKWQVSHALH